MKINHIYCGDAIEILKTFSDESVDCCVTSPPYYYLRDYGIDKQIGMEKTMQEYVDKISDVFYEVGRVLKKSGTIWLNLEDTYSYISRGVGAHKTKSAMQLGNVGSYFNISYEHDINLKSCNLKPKDLMGIPWTVALHLRDKLGFYLRQDIIWAKTNPMLESVRDKCTKSHEYIFLLSKSSKYYFDNEAIKEKAKQKSKNKHNFQFYTEIQAHSDGGRLNKLSNSKGLKTLTGLKNKRDVWILPLNGFKGTHFATFPTELVKPCILAGCPENGIVLDPFFGSGTVGVVAKQLNRNYIGIDINENYCKLAENRIKNGGIKNG